MTEEISAYLMRYRDYYNNNIIYDFMIICSRTLNINFVMQMRYYSSTFKKNSGIGYRNNLGNAVNIQICLCLLASADDYLPRSIR